jgi:hypothetical protein
VRIAVDATLTVCGLLLGAAAWSLRPAPGRAAAAEA